MSNETRWTPGPWEIVSVDELGKSVGYHRIRPVSGEMFGHYTSLEIATLYVMDEPEQQANARLIAAAPEMYEVLEEALDYPMEDSGWIKRAKAALAKARGE